VVQKPESLLTVDPGLATAPPDPSTPVATSLPETGSSPDRRDAGGVTEQTSLSPPGTSPDEPQPAGKE
jgi:hypothetical protein